MVEQDPIQHEDYRGRRVDARDLPDGAVRFKIVGMSFVENYPSAIHRLRHALETSGGKAPAKLVRDPDNAYDANAVRVEIPGLGHIGHVPAAMAARLAPELDMGATWLAKIEQVLWFESSPLHPGVKCAMMRFEDLDSIDEHWSAEILTDWLDLLGETPEPDMIRLEIDGVGKAIEANLPKTKAKYELPCAVCGYLTCEGEPIRKWREGWGHATDDLCQQAEDEGRPFTGVGFDQREYEKRKADRELL